MRRHMMRPMVAVINITVIILIVLIAIPLAAAVHVTTEAVTNPEVRALVTGKHWFFTLLE